MADALIRVVVQGNEAEAGLTRISGALGRLERGEPTMALRATRRAIDEMAIAATGLHPVLGRVASTLAEFGIGGAVGLGAVAGFAAIGLEIKTIIGFTDALDKKLLALNTTLAAGTPAAKLLTAGGFGQRLDELQHPGFTDTVKNTFWDLLTGGSATESGAAIGRRAEAATAEFGQGMALIAFHKTHTAQLLAESNALEASSIALEKAKLGYFASDEALDALAHRTDEVRLSTMQLSSGTRARILAEDDLARALAHTLELEQTRAEVGLVSREAEKFATFTAPDLAALKLPDIFGEEAQRQAGLQVSTLEKQGGQFAFETFNQDFLDNAQAGVTEALSKTPGWEKGGQKAGITMAAAFVTAVGQFQQGGAAGVAGGFGSLVTGASALKGAPAILGPIGFGLSAVGTLFSMFDHSAERRQREQMAELTRIRQNTDKRGQPDHISVTVLVNGKEVTGAILQDVMYGIRRAERTNAVPVLPGG